MQLKSEFEVLEGFRKLRMWSRNDERAPHKPLLALWSIGRCLKGEDRLVSYRTVEKEMTTLLNNFGPPRASHKPYEPFWRMQKDKIWEVPDAGRLVEDSSGSVSPKKLWENNVTAGFTSCIHNLFRDNNVLALKVAIELVMSHFTECLYDEVFDATIGYEFLDSCVVAVNGVDYKASEYLESVQQRRGRNSKFRDEVLEAYSYRCAICEYSIEFPAKNWPALEAVHIKWPGYNGPNNTPNGLSLCVLHHELFDWGAFTIQPSSLKVLVARGLLESEKNRWIGIYHKRRLPVIAKSISDRPANEFLNWHLNNVYRGFESFQNIKRIKV